MIPSKWLLFPLLRDSIPPSDALLSLLLAALFPTAFSFLFTVYCCLVSVTTEDCSLAPPEKGRITKARSHHQGS